MGEELEVGDRVEATPETPGDVKGRRGTVANTLVPALPGCVMVTWDEPPPPSATAINLSYLKKI